MRHCINTSCIRRAAYHRHFENGETARLLVARLLGKRRHFRFAWRVLMLDDDELRWTFDERYRRVPTTRAAGR